MQSDNLSDDEKNRIRAARAAPDPRFATPVTAAANLPPMTTDQRSQLNGNTLTLPHVMNLLSSADFATIQRGGRLNAAQRADMSLFLEGVVLGPPTPLQAEINLITAGDPRFRTYYGL